MDKNYCEIISYKSCNECKSIYAQRTISDFKNGRKNCSTCYEQRMNEYHDYMEIEINNRLAVNIVH